MHMNTLCKGGSEILVTLKMSSKCKMALLLVIMYRVTLVLIGITLFPETTRELAWFPDTGSYLRVATDLEDFALSEPIYRTPGYPILFTMANYLFNQWEIPILIVQLIMDLGISWMMWLIIGNRGRYRSVPILIYLMHPFSVVFAMAYLPATSAAIVLMSILYIEQKETINSYIKSLLIGLLISTGIAIRPMLLYAGILYAMFYIISAKLRMKRRLIFKLIILLLASSISSYMMKNYNMNNYGIENISIQSNRELVRRLLILSGEMTNEESYKWTERVEVMYTDTLGEVGYSSRDSLFKQETRRIFLANPVQIIKYHLFGWLRFLGPEQKYLGTNGSYENIPILLRILVNIFVSATFFLAIIGMIIGIFMPRKGRSRELSLIGLMWFVYAAVVHATLCYSYYAVPFLAVWITSGYIGWESYTVTKLQEPNSLLSRIVKRYRKRESHSDPS